MQARVTFVVVSPPTRPHHLAIDIQTAAQRERRLRYGPWIASMVKPKCELQHSYRDKYLLIDSSRRTGFVTMFQTFSRLSTSWHMKGWYVPSLWYVPSVVCALLVLPSSKLHALPHATSSCKKAT